MAHLQYMPGDPRLVDQLVYELKSKGIFDQFRKDCIADVDTRPAYQNLRQRVESSVSTFLSRQCWKPDLNKNQLREKLRKHILDGNYLEQGVERIVDQVVNPKVASVFIPQVEDLVYNYLGITRKKSIVTAETSNGTVDMLPTDLEAVSPGSVKSNDDKEVSEKEEENKMDLDNDDSKLEIKEDNSMTNETEIGKFEIPDSQNNVIEVKSDLDASMDCFIPLPAEEIKPEDIIPPKNSPTKEELERIRLPSELIPSDIPLPEEVPKTEKELYFKPITSEDDSSSDSSLRRNMSPLTPVRNFENENSCDAQQGFDNDSVDNKVEEKNSLSAFKFDIEVKSSDSSDVKVDKKEEQVQLSYQFNNQININTYNMYEESSNSNNLLIDYESDANSKINNDAKILDVEQNSEDKKDKKPDEKKSSHKSSHRSRDSHRHSSSKDKNLDSKHSSRDSSRHDKKSSSKDDSKPKSSDKDKSKDKSEKKDSKDSSRHRSSHKSSSHRDSKSHRSSSSSQRHSSKHLDDKKSSTSKEKSEKSSDKSSKERSSKDSKSSSHRSDKDRKSSSKKHDEKDKNKKEKKEVDDHYSLSGRNNNNRRSTDRDSNDGSSSSKGSQNPTSKTSDAKKDSKGSSSKSEPTSNSSDNTSPSDKEKVINESNRSPVSVSQSKPIVRVDSHLEMPFASPPRLPFVPDVTIKKPKYAANMEEAKRLMKMRKFMEEEQKRMNQEAALLLEFQANVRPSLSQVYSSIPGPELEFACVQHPVETVIDRNQEIVEEPTDSITRALTEMHEGSDIQNVPTEYVDEVNNTSIEAQLTGADDFEDIPENVNDQNQSIKTSDVETSDVTIIEPRSTLGKTDSCSSEVANKAAVNSPRDLKVKQDNDSIVALMEDTDIPSEVILPKGTEDTEIRPKTTEDIPLQYFDEYEKFNAELERDKFSTFLKSFTDRNQINKMYLINCDTYEENILKEASESFGKYEIVNYFRNGHLKLSKPKNVVNVNVTSEINLPLDYEAQITCRSTVFSPVKSECSFELSSEYDSRIDEIMTKTSRQQIMEIILGNTTAEDMPMTIDYCNESNIEDGSLKRKINEVECSVNNNVSVLTPNKIRKISDSDQISSTTEEIVVHLNNNQIQNNFRSKYLGKARRVGLPRPKKISLPNSPSSDKSVENYENPSGISTTPNGKLKTPRNKVQRYATSDLYKPKLHYLSRRNNIT